MNILFIHRDFPSQFKYLASILAQDPMNVVLFLTLNQDIPSPQGINKLVYTPKPITKKIDNTLFKFEQKFSYSNAVANMLFLLKSQNIKPDIIVGHSDCMFVKDIFPDVPFISYCEWMDNDFLPAIKFSGEEIDDDYKEQIKTDVSKIIELEQADGAISPTYWQKEQFPRDLQSKIQVIHDGVNTNVCIPNENAVFEFEGKNFCKQDEIITYAAQGMEPMRGFPQFMRAAEILLKCRPNLNIIVAGNDKVLHGKPLKNDSYKQKMIRELDLDLTRIHFTGELDYDKYLKLLQITSAHVYATYPYILSLSVIEAMSCETPLICSSTKPVLEVIKNDYNGLLYDFYDVDMLVQKITFALDNKEKMKEFGKNARKHVLENFDLRDKLAQQIFYIQQLINKK